jgi:hypothetical protein
MIASSINWMTAALVIQIFTAAACAVGFFLQDRYTLSSIQVFYTAANVGWLVLALGGKQ